ncbi:TIGR02206 family membrane protein [Streptococcus catagoni]|nr:TIGR02206 family membrane protein [Streptococcus catagoni]
MDFFALKESGLPFVPPFFYFLFIMLAPILILLTLNYYKSPSYRRFFLFLQFSQLVTLYGWYFLRGFPLQESLPLYHCRIAMLVIFLLPDKMRLKQLFMLLGVVGPILALFSPDLYPYPFLHASNMAFYLGHYALLVNALIYLLRYYDSSLSSMDFSLKAFSFLNLFLIVVDLLTKGNYGFLIETPLLHTHNLVFNFIVVTFAIVLLIRFVEMILLRWTLDQNQESAALSNSKDC